MNKNQLEIPLPVAAYRNPATPVRRRRGRAEWWFNQMRQVVNRAIDWSAAPSPRPEQMPLTLVRGE